MKRITGRCAALFVVLFILEFAPVAHANTLTTLAGDGNQATACFGKTIGGPIAAIHVSLQYPSGVAKDAAGNLYVADTSDNCVLKVDSNGLINDAGIIGNGTAGFSGDGGNAGGGINGNTELNSPRALAVDSAGNLYIADTFNSRIRKVDTNGIITTVAGGGSLRDNDGTPATSVNLSAPQGIAVDAAGNLYIGDSGFEKVYKVDTNGILTKVAGSGGSSYNGDGGPAVTANMIPMGVAIDGDGNLYIADWANGRIRKVDTNGIIHTVADSLNDPRGVAVDSIGNVYIADTSNHTVLKVDTNGNRTTLAGDGTQGNTNGELAFPSGVAVDSAENVYIADTGNNVIRGLLNFNTPVGDQVTVSLGGGTTVTFAHVSVAGNTTVSASGTGPAPPSGFQFGTPPIFLDISTTASYTAPVIVCLVYDPPQFINVNALKLFHNENNGLVDVTVSNDTTNHVICGQVSGFSVFVIAEPLVTWNLTLNTAGTGSGTVSGGGTYDSGQTATVSATPDAGSSFTGWSGANGAECATGSVLMNADKSCTATFTLNTYNLTAAGTPQRAEIGTSFAALQVTVKDGGGTPVSGVTVTFTVPSSGASGTFAGGVNAAITNANGVATSATFTANSTSGGYQVSATVPSGVAPAMFTLTNVDISVASNTGSQTVAPGAAANYTINFVAVAGKTTNLTTFACQNLPSLASCTFSPTSLPADSDSTAVGLQISTASGSIFFPSGLGGPSSSRFKLPSTLLLGLFATLVLGVAFLARHTPWCARPRTIRITAFALLLVAAGLVAGCSNNVQQGTPAGTPAGNYAVTVVATSGALQRTTTVSLMVQ